MALVGYLLLAFGLAMTILDLTTFIELIPPLADMNIPIAVWIGIAVIGAFVAMMFRRARD